MISKEAVKPLSRYADLLVVVGFLPVLGVVKFGHILKHKKMLQEARKKEMLKEKEAKAKAKGAAKQGAKEVSDEPELKLPPDSGLTEGIPPFSALVLLLLAELCACAKIFDPADMQVRRAVGVFGRV